MLTIRTRKPIRQLAQTMGEGKRVAGEGERGAILMDHRVERGPVGFSCDIARGCAGALGEGARAEADNCSEGIARKWGGVARGFWLCYHVNRFLGQRT